MYRIATLLIFCISLVLSANAQMNFDRLVGCWQLQAERDEVWECWKKIDDHHYSAETRKIINGKAEIIESATLNLVDDVWTYSPDVPANNGPVPFAHITLSDDLVIFQNLQHDSPNQIIYMFTGRNDLKVSLLDLTGGIATNTILMDFKRQEL